MRLAVEITLNEVSEANDLIPFRKGVYYALSTLHMVLDS